ncbi:hypothetical protein ACT29H_07535 [Thermophagus sp. OGC60D27]|uniref:hypothetical protein n=1 Tax=Thermophagus sp. OGC60D27 TaxID=3458415 RepID=UPI00403843DE
MKKFAYISIVLTFLALCLQSAYAQAPRKILRKAYELIDLELYEEALETLAPLTQKDNPEALLLKGFALVALEKLPEAITVYEKIMPHFSLDKGNRIQAIEAHYYLAQAYRLNEQPDKALIEFTRLKNFVTDKELNADIDREIQYCHNMKKLMNNPVYFKIEHLGKILNSKYEDHSPVTLYDESTIYFTSTRPVDSLESVGPYFENIFVSHWRKNGWTKPEVLNIPGYRNVNRATVGLTPDGQGLIFFQNDGLKGALFITYKTFEGWSDPQPLPPPVNSGYNETHASISPDGNTIYFSSERPGGLGGKDIYYSHRLPDGSWGKPINAGETINTEMDEEGPFIHPDNQTLYFSSTGHNSMGGYDIFKSTKTENGWTKAQNIGYPVNSPSDDVFYVPTPNGQRVYFSSRKEGSIGQSDLFVLHFPEDNERSMAVVSSHIFNSQNQPADNATIYIINNSTNKRLGSYKVNPSTGKFVTIIPSFQEYKLLIECPDHQPYSQIFKLGVKDDYKSKNRAIYLPPITLKPMDKGGEPHKEVTEIK